jgi:CBS domain-containing protein
MSDSSRTRWVMLGLATLGFVINFWAWALLSPLGPRFKNSLHLNSFAPPLIMGAVWRLARRSRSRFQPARPPGRLPRPRMMPGLPSHGLPKTASSRRNADQWPVADSRLPDSTWLMVLTRHEPARVVDAMVRFPKTHGPGSVLDDMRAFFADDHVHMALVVAADGRLITTIERHDVAVALPGSTPASALGTLDGRTTRPADLLEAAAAALLGGQRRRLAVIDDSGRLVGLLCLKKNGTGYCSDGGIRERANGRTHGDALTT